jgi:Legionella pneumophila major outer membrane protein precursor
MTRLACQIGILIILAGATCARGEGVTPFADLLVWHASQETSSAWSSVITPQPSLFPPAQSTFTAADVQFDWNAGLRFGFAHEPDEDSWDAKLYYTWFPTAQSVVIRPGNQLVIPETFSGFLSGDTLSFTGGAVDWSLAFNTLDFEAGHEFQISESLFVRPSLGVKGAFIDQKIRTRWSNAVNAHVASERVDHAFRGLGPSFGIGGRWRVPQYTSLNFVGSFSGAFLYGVWNATETYQRADPQPTFNTYRTFTTSMKDSSFGTLMLRYFFGLEWTQEGEFPVSARLGYELQWWANQQRLPTFQQLPMHGDLTLQGLSCGISVCF